MIEVEPVIQQESSVLSGHRLIIVSNREPFQVVREEDSLRLERSAGGLISALDPVVQSSNGLWICWDGAFQEDDYSFEDLSRLAELNNIEFPYPLQMVKLSEEDIEHYYYGFANQQIWPLFHYFPSRYAFQEKEWAQYTEVNQKFAQSIVENATPEDFIWIQDYHLMLVPSFVREKQPDLNLGFFCHVPFPHYEVFRVLPTRREILRGMLGADIIGFHTPDYAKYFMECAEMLLPGEVKVLDGETLMFRSRQVRVKAYPISIDYDSIDAISRRPETDEAVAQLRSSFQPAELIGLGIDRLDYSKGIFDRMECISLFFDRYPEYRKRLVFIQIAVPSRTKVEDYQQLKHEVDEAVGRINGRFSEDGWAPIHYLYRGFPMEELVAYYKAADFALVNPLRDGMNLVAKEYCAAHSDDNGALILSEMTGSAYQLKESFLVNPYDYPSVVEAMHAALSASNEEKRERMIQMRKTIQENNIEKWLNDFLADFNVAIQHRYDNA